MTDKIKTFLTNFKSYWKQPPKGRYMSYKEIFSLSFGGIGVKFLTYCIGQMIISIGNSLIGNTIGIDPSAIYVIYIISVLSGFPLTALRAKMIDNARSMKGKYRPYIISMGIPSTILGIGFILMPYETMGLYMKCAVVLAFNIGFQFFYNFYVDAYDSLINVLSPNSIERSDVISVKSVIENLSPSLASIFLPIVAKLITGQNTLYDLKIYRVLFPPMLIFGFVISMLVYANTEEKIVQAKTHVVQVKFSDAFRAIARNKYFWIISLAGWLGFLETSFNSIIGWMYNYQTACSPAQYSLIVAIGGNASFWPNLLAPLFIRKYGKKAILVFTNLLNIIFILLMLPIVRMTGNNGIIWLLLACTFVNSFVSALGHLLNPSIQADIRDYQQYITGERIDGMFAAVGLIGNVITLATSSVLPALYERAGLNADVAVSLGYSASNVYDVLYDRTYFIKISSVLVIASVVGAIMNVIPFFFYNLTETDQKGMINVLKIRALFEDYGNNVLKDESLVETVEIINEAGEYSRLSPITLSTEKIAAARKVKDKALIKAAKEEYKKDKETNIKIEIANRVMDELNRFKTEQGLADIDHARKIVDAGLDGFISIDIPTRKEAKAMPKTTEKEKEIRRNTLMQIENTKVAKKAIAKYFKDGIKEFDSSVFEKLFSAEDQNEIAAAQIIRQIKAANEAGNKEEAKKLRQTLKELRREKDLILSEIKKATDENSIFYRAAKPYHEAKKLLTQAENYAHLEEINELYLAAKERLANA